MQKILGGTLSESNDKYIEENTMLLGILTLLTALCISAVAIYYSVAGLVAIFAAADAPSIPNFRVRQSSGLQ